jgi:hypothetical protein
MKYKIIARKFALGHFKECFGPCVVSKDAIYLIIDPTLSVGGVGLGPAIANLANEAMSSAVAKADTPYTQELEELPSEVTGDPEWPVTQTTGRVFVVPRESVTQLKYPWWGGLTIITPQQKFQVSPNMFLRKGVVRFLKEQGWEL